MRKDNPAVFECPENRAGLHTWKREKDGKATCVACKLVLNQADADEVFETSPMVPTQRGVCISPSCDCMGNFGHCVVTGRLPI